MARILVVEDDVMNSRLFDLILSRMGGHEVIIAKDAEDAVQYGSSGDVDLIVMDVSLQNWIFKGSEVNGVDLTKIIKGASKSRNIPVLLATAHTMKEDRENLLSKSGADGYFPKPIQNHLQFLAEINKLLEKTYAMEKKNK